MFFTVKNHDFCEGVEKRKKQNFGTPLSNLIYTIYERAEPKFMEGCPYYGRFNISYFDPNVKVADLLPPIVPSGN